MYPQLLNTAIKHNAVMGVPSVSYAGYYGFAQTQTILAEVSMVLLSSSWKILG
jgi:hypothetical protein